MTQVAELFLEEGRAEGRAEGRVEGRAEGSRLEQEKIIINMYRDRKSVV